jgi:Domain of unknown function (DUF222)
MDAVVVMLESAVTDVVDVDVTGLSDGEVHRALMGLLTQRNALDAAIHRLAGEWTNRGIWAEDGSRAAGARLARDSHLRKPSAYGIVRRAAALAEMPETARALAAGTLTVEHVDLLAAATAASHRREHFIRDEERLVEFCVELPYWAAEKAVQYWICRVDALTGHDDGPAPRWRDRQASSRRGIDGEVHVEAIFDPVGGATFTEAWDRIDNELRLADEQHPDGVLRRTPAQRRLDALVEMAVRATSNGAGGVRPRPLVTAVVGDHSFRRLCELSDGTVVRPAELAPYVGELDVNAILFDGPLHAIAGTTTRGFTGLLRRAIEVRDRVCQHPASDGDPINRCDVDHLIPKSRGGITCQHNGRLLELGRNRDPRRRNLTAADITVWDDDPVAITTRQRLQALINQHPRPPDETPLVRDLTNGAPHLAQRLEASPVNTFEQPVDGCGAELVHGDRLIAEEDVPRSG